MFYRRAPRGAAHLRDDDAGAALVLVIGSMMLLMTLSLAALASVSVSQRLARHTQDYSAATAAAQSGVEEFISRLNRADDYGAVIDCTNVAWQGPTTTTNPCGWNSTTPVGWVPVVPGETDPEAAHFHYEIDASGKATSGSVLLTVTGRVNGVHRTLQTTVGKGGSTDYVYYTDFESGDPANVQAYSASDVENARKNNKDRANACGFNGHDAALKWWQKDSKNKTRANYSCQEITFTSGDVLDGAVHTNDTIYSTQESGKAKPSFEQRVTTSDPRCEKPGATPASWETNCLRSGGKADFNGIAPGYQKPFSLDDTSAAFANHPGCHYYGSTRIIFQADGTMRVWNKKTVNGNVAPVAIPSPTRGMPSCGSLGDLHSDAGAVVAVPHDMVIYAATATATPMRQCQKDELGGFSGRRLPLGTYTGQAPTKNASYTVDSNMTEDTKMCARGNLYVEGVVKGRVTLASAESIIVTGDLVLAGGTGRESPDMLGLVATNSVEVYHPRRATVSAIEEKGKCKTWVFGYCVAYETTYAWGSPSGDAAFPGTHIERYVDPTTNTVFPATGVQIAGSIQTLQHSFLVQKYDVGGEKGQLYVKGSIAQRWRGIVGKGANGYKKLYQYDPRLQYAVPPYFPRWANSQWSLRYAGEISTPDYVRNG